MSAAHLDRLGFSSVAFYNFTDLIIAMTRRKPGSRITPLLANIFLMVCCPPAVKAEVFCEHRTDEVSFGANLADETKMIKNEPPDELFRNNFRVAGITCCLN